MARPSGHRHLGLDPWSRATARSDLSLASQQVRTSSLFLSVESRDAMLGGMDAGMDEDFEPIDELIEAGDLVAATVC